MKNISQREARALKRRVEELEQEESRRRNSWVREYPGGVNIAQATYEANTSFLPAVVENSRRLGHAVVCVADSNKILFYALPLGRRP